MINRFTIGSATNTTYRINVDASYNVINLAEVSGMKCCSLKPSFCNFSLIISILFAQDNYNVDAVDRM